MNQIYLIRHAKSSWSDVTLDDYDRPLNGRGKRDGPEMGRRLGVMNIRPDLIVSSPAKRAKKTAKIFADCVGYKKKKISYVDSLYLGGVASYLSLIESLKDQYKVIFLVGHNHVITELGELLTGQYLVNVPTAGVVAIKYDGPQGFITASGVGELLFFDYPKNRG